MRSKHGLTRAWGASSLKAQIDLTLRYRAGSKFLRHGRERYAAMESVLCWCFFSVQSCLNESIALCRVLYRFGRPRPHVRRTSTTGTRDHGHIYPFVLPFKRATFTMLLGHCRLSQQLLDLREHRATAGHSASFVDVQQDKSSGAVSSVQSLFAYFLLIHV